MGALLRDALRRLCVEAGWSYAVFWRVIGGSNPTQFVWEDGHCEKKRSISGFEAMDLLLKEQGLMRNSCNNSFVELECQVEDNLSALVHGMMVHHVHVLGDGIIGRSALTGDHQWILRESFNGHGSEEVFEMNHQFLAGIQTVAVIPVIPYGVVQLGSVQMVMEDTGFVNHVKCLFAHVGRVPGALLAIIQQNLSQKSQILRIPQSDCHSENFCTKMGESLSAASGGSNSQLVKSPVLTSVAQSSCSSFVPLHEKMLPTVSEVPLIEQIIRATTMPLSHKILPLTQPVDKFVPHLNNQLEGGNLGVQALDPNSDLRSIQLGLPYSSNSEVEGQSSRMTTGLSSHVSRFLEKELSVSVSSFRSENPTNLSEPTLNDAKTNQISSQCVFSGSLQDLDIFGKFESLSNTNDVGSLSTPPGGTTDAISITCSTQLSNQTNHLNGCEVMSNASCLGIPSNKSSESILNAWKQGHRNDSVKNIDNLSAKSDVQGSCYGSLSGFSQDRRLSQEVSSLTHIQDEKVSSFFLQPTSQNDLFDIVGLDVRKEHFHGSLDSMLVQGGIANSRTLAADISACNTQLDVGPVVDSVDYDMSCSTVFSETVPDQLLDAVVSKVSSVVKQGTNESVSGKTLTTKIGSSSLHGSPAYVRVVPCQHKEGESLDLSPVLLKTEAAGLTLKTEDCLQRSEGYKSQISLWVEDGQNMRSNNIPAVPCKGVDETNKLNRKRARPGESPRPRPKDRQMIQDRVKELREIVPNGAKLSIDALLEKTIKHMLFLQSVTKHADKLKKTGEPKIISKDGGLLLKDNFEGGATWAFEVGSQSMICPIIVEDLNPPRQMLVEMLCEDRGFFLEIADLIRGLGLTILRGVMEARKDKVWARFAVEANRDVTRMEIFLSLVRLLEPTAVTGLKPQGLESSTMPHLFHHASIPATGSS